MKNEIKQFEDRKKSESKELELKIYNEPKITKLGAMQRVTLGGSIGTGDSGAPNTENYNPNG